MRWPRHFRIHAFSTYPCFEKEQLKIVKVNSHPSCLKLTDRFTAKPPSECVRIRKMVEALMRPPKSQVSAASAKHICRN